MWPCRAVPISRILLHFCAPCRCSVAPRLPMPVAGGADVPQGGPDVDAIAMIFCFSATGNSRWVAGELARHLSDQVVDISDCLRRRSLPAGLAGAARVGVVFPIHGWHVPAPVGRFLRMLSAGLPGAAYRYAVCTCGDDVGKGLAGLRRSLGFGAVWTVAMPNTLRAHVCARLAGSGLGQDCRRTPTAGGGGWRRAGLPPGMGGARGGLPQAEDLRPPPAFPALRPPASRPRGRRLQRLRALCAPVPGWTICGSLPVARCSWGIAFTAWPACMVARRPP